MSKWYEGELAAAGARILRDWDRLRGAAAKVGGPSNGSRVRWDPEKSVEVAPAPVADEVVGATIFRKSRFTMGGGGWTEVPGPAAMAGIRAWLERHGSPGPFRRKSPTYEDIIRVTREAFGRAGRAYTLKNLSPHPVTVTEVTEEGDGYVTKVSWQMPRAFEFGPDTKNLLDEQARQMADDGRGYSARLGLTIDASDPVTWPGVYLPLEGGALWMPDLDDAHTVAIALNMIRS